MVNLYVESLPPVYLCCDTLITAEDVASAVRFQNEKRRREHLAWRRIVRSVLGVGIHIDYNAVGAPVVDVEGCYISVAHSADSVAVAVADEPVGVDIESLDRDFDRAKQRYMNVKELALSSDKYWGCYAWCAKEAIYKLCGKRGLELREELLLEQFDSENMIIYGRVVDTGQAVVKLSHHAPNLIVAVATFR